MVVIDSKNSRDGAFLEKIGFYNPFLPKDDPLYTAADVERAKYWISVGAKPSNRVALLLSRSGVCEKPSFNETPKKSAPKKKAMERMQQQSASAG
jgi:small subunit ribosomal protein S16